LKSKDAKLNLMMDKEKAIPINRDDEVKLNFFETSSISED
jgi:hypothetical protein